MTERREQGREGPSPRVMASVPMHPDTNQRIVRAAAAVGASRSRFMLDATLEKVDAVEAAELGREAA